ncbi:hypothetical protein V9T40_007162 [Parthenolecanium corni]|uniref:F-box domain-containing protein n=1 Tax=Parthenolecanium corni TaxID=536013 RepID=A0AAN9TU24_9HEMI
MTSPSAASRLPNLPVEVWEKIFSHLFLEDLKSVRLTCRLFYNACNSSAIQKNEEFIFYGNEETENIKSLMSVKRKVWNLRFYSADLTYEHILSFIQKHGPDICSLAFEDCEAEPGTLAKIIEHCENLRSLTVHCENYRKEQEEKRIFAGFEALQENNIVRKNVESLTLAIALLKSNWQWYDLLGISTDSIFGSIFAPFPNIKQLKMKIGCPWFDDFSKHPSELTSNEAFTVSSVYDELFKIRDQLEKLELAVTRLNTAESYLEIAEIEMKNLKELSLGWMDTHDLNISITNPFVRFNHLTEITWHVQDKSEEKSTVVSILLNTLKELNSLSVYDNMPFTMDEECFQAIVRSHLTTLIIENNKWFSDILTAYPYFHGDDEVDIFLSSNFDSSSLANSLSPNYTLKHLKAVICDDDSFLLFSTYFPRLDGLAIDFINLNILGNICEYQKNLRRLKLNYILSSLSDVNPVSLENELPKRYQLGYVKYLCLREKIWLRHLLDQCVFPELESLTIYLNNLDAEEEEEYDLDAHLRLLSTLTQLKHLEISYKGAISFQSWLVFFEGLSKMNLQYLYVKDENEVEAFNDVQYRTFFDVCSSLRVLNYNHLRYKYNGVKSNDDKIVIKVCETVPDDRRYKGIPIY